MWYAVQTAFRKEREARDMIAGLDGVREVYLPICKRTVTRDDGSRRSRFLPTISGILFANVDDSRVAALVDGWGRFKPGAQPEDPAERPASRTDGATRARLLRPRSGLITKDAIIVYSRVPSADIERLRLYNDQLAAAVDDLRIVDTTFQALASINDTVLVLDGPFKGFEGVIKQVKTHGDKDRRLLLGIGNFCVSIPAARTHRNIVVREATAGDKARAVNAWRHIDQLIGRAQAEVSASHAASLLRQVVGDLSRGRATLDDYRAGLPTGSPAKRLLESLTPVDEGCLLSLCGFFHAADGSASLALTEMIGDVTLRPFLTPTPGVTMPQGAARATLRHDGFTEIILKTDLSRHFAAASDLLTARRHGPDDFIYYAHLGVFPRPGGGHTLVANWNGFHRQYALLSPDDKARLLADMLRFGYTRLHALLTQADNPQPAPDAATAADAPLTFRRLTTTVAGFALDTPAEPTPAHVARLLDAAAPAAVEIWQGTRLLPWRRLAQRHVLLHRLPTQE